MGITASFARPAIRISACVGIVWALAIAFVGSSCFADEIGPLKRDAQGNIVPATPLEQPGVAPAPVQRETPRPAGPVSGVGAAAPSRAAQQAPPKPPAARAESEGQPVKADAALLGSAQVTGIVVEHHDGQTFVTWKDAAQGEQDAAYRYALYRSDRPITEAALASATLVEWGIVYNSAKQYGTDFAPKDRLDPTKPTVIIRDGGKPLPVWSGMAVYTAQAAQDAFYAVVATDTRGNRLSRIVPGQNATAQPVEEKPAPLEPIKLHDAIDGAATQMKGSSIDKSLTVFLHPSNDAGRPANEEGDYYLFFGNRDMGYRDGIPGVFSVEPAVWRPAKGLELYMRDAILKPDGSGAFETYWFGYYATPQWAPGMLRAYPFTEARLLWAIDWTVRRYHIDRNRIYAAGQSMGGWGSASFAYRHPEIFAAIYPMMPKMRERLLPSLKDNAAGLIQERDEASVPMPDGTNYFTRMDMVRFVMSYKGELPFIAWSIGRHDGFAAWPDQVDMVKAMEATHRGFAFAWNDGGHDLGPKPMEMLAQTYPPEKFSQDRSYPAFSHSSIDSDPGTGDLATGDKEGGINLGFAWNISNDSPSEWQVGISNMLAKADMTVDVTPRRTQKFKIKPGEKAMWRSSTGQSGTEVADQFGDITAPKLRIEPGHTTVLTVTVQ